MYSLMLLIKNANYFLHESGTDELKKIFFVDDLALTRKCYKTNIRVILITNACKYIRIHTIHTLI